MPPEPDRYLAAFVLLQLTKETLESLEQELANRRPLSNPELEAEGRKAYEGRLEQLRAALWLVEQVVMPAEQERFDSTIRQAAHGS